jgi:hypothetical protein
LVDADGQRNEARFRAPQCRLGEISHLMCALKKINTQERRRYREGGIESGDIEAHYELKLRDAMTFISGMEKAWPRIGHPAVVSCGREEVSVARLRRLGVPLGPMLYWGSTEMYAHIDAEPMPLLVLDVASSPLSAPEMTRAVSVLSLAASVVVLGDDETDGLRAFQAGAYNVLHRRLPPAILTARLRADTRRCRATAWPANRPHNLRTASQRLLFDILERQHKPICCHDLSMFFGSLTAPLSMRALRARLQRLLPTVEAAGMKLVTDLRRGRLTTYQLVRQGQTSSHKVARPVVACS